MARYNLDDFTYCAKCDDLHRWEETDLYENAEGKRVRMCYNCGEETREEIKQAELEAIKEDAE